MELAKSIRRLIDPRPFYPHTFLSPMSPFPFPNSLPPSKGATLISSKETCNSAPHSHMARNPRYRAFQAVPSIMKQSFPPVVKKYPTLKEFLTYLWNFAVPPNSLWKRLFYPPQKTLWQRLSEPSQKTLRFFEFDGSYYNPMFAFIEAYLLSKEFPNIMKGTQVNLPEHWNIVDVFEGALFTWRLTRISESQREEEFLMNRWISFSGTRTFSVTYSLVDSEEALHAYLHHIRGFFPEDDLHGEVRVTNLSHYTREADLLTLFKHFGPVIKVCITCGRLGFGMFLFKKDAKAAIFVLNGFAVDNHILRVGWAEPIIDKKTVRVDNISLDTDELALHDLFNPFGVVCRVFIAFDPQTGMSKGFGYVTFYSKVNAKRAIRNLNGSHHDNLILEVKWPPKVLVVDEKLDQVSEMSSRLTSESRINADKARDLNVRIWTNRQSAARSKERKMHYISGLERKVQTPQTEATTLSTQLNMLQRDSSGLSAENHELKLRLHTVEQQVNLQDAENDALRDEIQRLKVMTGQTNTGAGSMMNFGPSHVHSQPFYPSNHPMHSMLAAQQFQQLQIQCQQSQQQQQQHQLQQQQHQLQQHQHHQIQQQTGDLKLKGTLPSQSQMENPTDNNPSNNGLID